MESDKLDVLDVQGDAKARGRQQAASCVDRLPVLYRALEDVPLLPAALPRVLGSTLLRTGLGALGLYYWRLHAPLLREHRGGRYRELVESLASGLGTSPSSVYGLNAFEIESALPAFRLGCTALAFSPDLTTEGTALLAYNHDFPPSFEPHLLLRRSRPAGGLANLALTYPVMAGAVAGVNEAGVGASLNQAFATDASRTRPALLTTLLLQDVLETSRGVEDAVALCRDARVACGGLVTVVDATGDRAVVELATTRTAVRREPSDRILHAFNKYEDPSLEEVEVPLGAVTIGLGSGYDVHECNVERERRWRQIAERAIRHDETRIRQLLGDHDGGTGSANTICVHGDAMNETIASIIIDPVRRCVRAMRGNPCRGRFERFDVVATRP